MDLSLAVVEHKPAERPHDISIECASHLSLALHPDTRRIATRRICALLKGIEQHGTRRGDSPIKFDAIAARGLSGFLFAPIVAMTLNKTLLVVRKGESCHSGRTVEGDVGARSYIIIDDFISSGNTVAATVNDIAEAVPLAVCVGMVHYSGIEDDDRWVGKSHEHRCTRQFYDEYELRGYTKTIQHQRKRVTDKLAQNQAYALSTLAQIERRRRGPQPDPSDCMEFFSTFAWRNADETLADAAKAGA